MKVPFVQQVKILYKFTLCECSHVSVSQQLEGSYGKGKKIKWPNRNAVNSSPKYCDQPTIKQNWMVAAYTLIHCICGSLVHTVRVGRTTKDLFQAKMSYAGIGHIWKWLLVHFVFLNVLKALSVTKIMKWQWLWNIGGIITELKLKDMMTNLTQ
jgi:hypothetical protein